MNKIIRMVELVLRSGFCVIGVLFALIGVYALIDSRKVVSITEVFAEDAVFEQVDIDNTAAG